ncbi:MAG TPA: NUDIX domain-containing protein [Candidatus Nanoarchaeia archaeon]|nr:NUDIX domain-containing protein [Candidatus Nanoarchaeia archaeon]
MPTDGLLDLIDDNEQVIDTKPRSEVYKHGLNNFQVINVFVKNSEGKLWIPRRGPNKRIFPLCLDVSVGGHVESGESYYEAFKRETKEEIDVDIITNGFTYLGHLTPQQYGVSAYMEVYEIKLDEVKNYNKDDFVEYYWLYPKEVIERLTNGDKAKDDLPKLVKHFYL